MSYLFCILIGFAAGLALRHRRALETKRALESSEYLREVAQRTVEILARDLVRRDVAIANIKRFAVRTHMDRLLNLGGSLSLPEPARRTRQLAGTAPLGRVDAQEPSRNGGSAFLKRAN